MDRKEYCDRVLAQVGRLTSDEANDLRNDLAGHIEDHAEALVEHGYTEDAAYGRAVALMGDPEETGRALRRCVTPPPGRQDPSLRHPSPPGRG